MLELAGGIACCGIGAEGKLDGFPEVSPPCAALQTGMTRARQIGNRFFIRGKANLPVIVVISVVVSLTLEPQSADRDIRVDRQPAQ